MFLSYGRKRKAVSTMIATLILIGITAALGSFIYWYATSYVASNSKIFSIAITDLKLSKTTKGSTSFLISIRNQGTVNVKLESIIIRDDNDNQFNILSYENRKSKKTITSPQVGDDEEISLNPGSSITVIYLGPLNVTPGSSYIVIVATNHGAQQATVECTLNW